MLIMCSLKKKDKSKHARDMVFNHCSAIIEFPFGNTQRLREMFRPLCSMFGQDIAGISIFLRIKGCEIRCSGDCVTAPSLVRALDGLYLFWQPESVKD